MPRLLWCTIPRPIVWRMEMNADVSIPVDYIRTAFEVYRSNICSLDFIR